MPLISGARQKAVGCRLLRARRERPGGRRVQSQLQMRVCVRMPVIQLQHGAEIRLASIDTNVSGSNPKRPMHEDVHSDT